MKDIILPNGFVHKELYDTKDHIVNPYYYLRIDNSTGCVYRYSYYFNEEFLIDSQKMMAGDIIINGYGNYLEYTLVDTIEFFGENRIRKHFFLSGLPMYYQNKYAEGLGEVYRLDHFEYIVGTDVTSEITCAKINGVEFGQLVSVHNSDDKLNSYSLSQNYPNPFNPTTKIKFKIPNSPLNPSPYQGEGNRERFVTLKVYDVLGKEIASLVCEEKPAGTYEVEFNIHSGFDRNLPSGVYFYRLQVFDPESSSGQSFVETKKMVLMK